MSVELDDTVARNLQAAAGLVDMLGKNPKTRQGLFKLIKEVRPDVNIPEIDAVAATEAKITKVQESIEALTKKLTQDKEDDKLEKERARLTRDHGFTEEGIKELEAFMLKKNVPDHEVARLAMEASRPKPRPERPSFRLRSVFEESDKDDKEWLDNPDSKLDRVLDQAFAELQAGMV